MWHGLIGGCKAESPTPPPLAWASAGGVDLTLPRKFYPRLARPQFQTHAGSCTAHGASFALESDALARTDAVVQVCRLDLYRGSRLIENNGAEHRDGGAFPSLVHRWISDYGTLSEVHGAYDADLVTTWAPDPEWDAERRAWSADLVPIPVQIGPILAELGAGRCVPFWHKVYGQMANNPAGGVEIGPDGGNVLGGHYRAFIGYDMDDSAPGFGAGVLYAANWWKGWGIAHPWAGVHPDYEEWVQSVSIIPFSVLTAPKFIDGAARIARGLDVQA